MKTGSVRTGVPKPGRVKGQHPEDHRHFQLVEREEAVEESQEMEAKGQAVHTGLKPEKHLIGALEGRGGARIHCERGIQEAQGL